MSSSLASDSVSGSASAPASEPVPTPSTVLEVSDLSVSLSGRPVLSDVTLSVHSHEFVGLLGPNGAGKTTLLRSILGFIPLKQGSVRVAGEPMTGRRRSRARQAVGYVPQKHQFAWEFPISVHHAVLNGRVGNRLMSRPRLEDYSAVASALKKVNLADLADRPIGQLSGGQRQRVLVARALASNPRILLLDEPFTGMDIPSAEQLLELFHSLAEEGVAVLMSTHDLGEAVDHCDRLVLLKGTVMAEGRAEDLRCPDPWVRTYGVRSDSPLLRTVGAL